MTGFAIGSAPAGEDTSLDGTEKFPVTGSRFVQTGTMRDYVLGQNGAMWNGKISPTVSANDLVLTLLTASGGTPSATDPVKININGTIRSVTAALSVTKADATNWFAAGSAELATKEIDYFAYLGYNATDGVVLGFSRIPYASLYSEFSATTTDEKYCAISTITNAAAGDDYVNIGRFAATLSAGAGYTWTVPAFTSSNLIQRPVDSTRRLRWTPAITYSGGTTDPTSNTPDASTTKYQVIGRNVVLFIYSTLVVGTGNRTNTMFSTPFSANNATILASMSSITVSIKYSTASYISANSITFVETMTSNGIYYVNGVVPWSA